jgi:cytochrome P450 family 144
MKNVFFHARRELLTETLVMLIRFQSFMLRGKAKRRQLQAGPVDLPENPKTPEDFHPLNPACFQNPYPFYQMLRDEYPIYELQNGVVCVSRYEDIVRLSRDTETFSSTHQGVVAGLRKGQDMRPTVERNERLSALGIIPADVLATADAPMHTTERKVGHSALNARFVKSLEAEVEMLCREMMDAFLDRGELEFMAEFGWKLPMRLIIKLLGLPEKDFLKIKQWCVHAINSQSGIAQPAELARSAMESLRFHRYCWRHYLAAKRRPQDNIIGLLANAAKDDGSDFDDQRAVSAIFQLLIAGSDSSATSMGNALKLLIENPEIQQQIRDDMDLLPSFVEEVFRLESAFQGHFRWAKSDTEVNGVTLPAGSRLFLMWASGNRDERVFDNPNQIDLFRHNGKKHLTFGHGIHACLGRELARMEIRIVLREFLLQTENLKIAGDAPFIASMFARTLVQLPISFTRKTSALAATPTAAKFDEQQSNATA